MRMATRIADSTMPDEEANLKPLEWHCAACKASLSDADFEAMACTQCGSRVFRGLVGMTQVSGDGSLRK